jgi:hypothetical protein
VVGGVGGVGEFRNSMEPSNTVDDRFKNERTKKNESMETKNLRKHVFTSKVVNPFTCALGPPFIGRQRDFYIPRLPSNLKNISNVNMYMNVLYIL